MAQGGIISGPIMGGVARPGEPEGGAAADPLARQGVRGDGRDCASSKIGGTMIVTEGSDMVGGIVFGPIIRGRGLPRDVQVGGGRQGTHGTVVGGDHTSC